MKPLSRSGTSTRQVTLTIVSILVALIVLAVLNSSLFDSAWILMTFMCAVAITSVIIAPKLLPIGDTKEEFTNARKVFLNYLTGGNVLVTLVREGAIVYTTPSAPRTSRTDEDEELTWSIVIADSTSIVVLRAETGISRLAGASFQRGHLSSGVTLLYSGERIDSIVDLRPQVRRRKVRARTRDGINIDLRLRVQLVLRHTRALPMRELEELKYQAKPNVRWPPPFTWQQRSILGAYMRRAIREQDATTEFDWADEVFATVVAVLRMLVSQYTFNALTSPATVDEHPLVTIRDELLRTVRQRLDAYDGSQGSSGVEVRSIVVRL